MSTSKQANNLVDTETGDYSTSVSNHEQQNMEKGFLFVCVGGVCVCVCVCMGGVVCEFAGGTLWVYV